MEEPTNKKLGEKMTLDTTTFLLTMIFTLVISSFIFYFVARNAVDSSRLMRKVEKLESDLAELKQKGNTDK